MLYFSQDRVMARPMTREEYNDYRGRTLPDDEDGSDTGYLIEELTLAGHISWLPTESFNVKYSSAEEMTFGMAIEAARFGRKIARTGWNGKDMFVVLRPYENNEQAHFLMWTANGDWQPGWLASQADMLAKDWRIIN